MKTWAALTTLAVLFGPAGLAQAAQLLSPPFPTAINTSGACYVRNTGAAPVTVHVSVFSNNGLSVNPGFQNCNGVGPLGAGHTCVVLVDDLPDSSYAACSVTAGNVSKLRGTFELREITPTLRVLVAEDLR
jgi:hypothetical protein